MFIVYKLTIYKLSCFNWTCTWPEDISSRAVPNFAYIGSRDWNKKGLKLEGGINCFVTTEYKELTMGYVKKLQKCLTYLNDAS